MRWPSTLYFFAIASLGEVSLAIHHGSRLATKPSIDSPKVQRATRGVQHVTLKDDTLAATFHPFQQITQKNTEAPIKIPRVLHLTSKEDTLEKLPPKLQTNMKNEIRRNKEFTVKYWGDVACHDYLTEFYDSELLARFNDAGRGLYGGAYRGDICRAAVLFREGGFYMDVDVQLAVPLRDLVDDQTSFMGVRHSNMLFGAIPHHQILQDTIKAIPPWYVDFDKGVFTGILGPATMERAFAQSCECGMNCFPDVRKYRCGNHIVQMFNEMKVPCTAPTSECPSTRIQHIESLKASGEEFNHLQFAILGPNHNMVVGWSRFEQCPHYGCGGSGYTDKDWVDISSDAAMSFGGDSIDASIVGSSASDISEQPPGFVEQTPTMPPEIVSNSGSWESQDIPSITRSSDIVGSMPLTPAPVMQVPTMPPEMLSGPHAYGSQDAPSQSVDSGSSGVLSSGNMPITAPQPPYPLNTFSQAPMTQSSPSFGQSAPATVIQPVIITVPASQSDTSAVQSVASQLFPSVLGQSSAMPNQAALPSPGVAMPPSLPAMSVPQAMSTQPLPPTLPAMSVPQAMSTQPLPPTLPAMSVTQAIPTPPLPPALPAMSVPQAMSTPPLPPTPPAMSVPQAMSTPPLPPTPPTMPMPPAMAAPPLPPILPGPPGPPGPPR